MKEVFWVKMRGRLSGSTSRYTIEYGMKYITLILLALISISCSQRANSDVNFEWLLGSWLRTNDQEGNLTYEHWKKNSDTEYTGLGCTLHKGDTIFKEQLKLYRADDMWKLEVSGVNENPTSFLMISHTESSFECENKNNEFPKNIAYSMQDDLLYARIFDDDTEITFLFEKMELK